MQIKYMALTWPAIRTNGQYFADYCIDLFGINSAIA